MDKILSAKRIEMAIDEDVIIYEGPRTKEDIKAWLDENDGFAIIADKKAYFASVFNN